MLQAKWLSSNSLEAAYDLKRAKRLRPTKFDQLPLRRGMSDRERAHFCDIAERDPANGACSGPVDAGCRVRVVESQSWTQPHFHEPARLDHSKVEIFERVFDLFLRLPQRRRDTGSPPKRHE